MTSKTLKTSSEPDDSVMREIEYKYFVNASKFKHYLQINKGNAERIERIRQHYIAKDNGNTVRLRVSESSSGVERVLCIKGSGSGINELESTVSKSFADAVLSSAFQTSSLVKSRYTFNIGKKQVPLHIEVDVYEGHLYGIVVAEIEVPHDGFEVPDSMLPDFVIRVMSESESKQMSNYSLTKIDGMAAKDIERIIKLM